jgi:hypothetical protein
LAKKISYLQLTLSNTSRINTSRLILNINNGLISSLNSLTVQSEVIGSQTSFNQVSEGIDSDTSDFQKFVPLARHYYKNHTDGCRLNAALPLLNLFQDQMVDFGREMANKDSSFYTKILEKDSTGEDFQCEFFILLDTLKKSNDPTKIVHFFNKIIKHTESLQPAYNPFLENIVTLFQSKRLDLFAKPSAFFIRPELKFSSQELYRIAVKSTQYLCRALTYLNNIWVAKYTQVYSLEKTDSIVNELKLINHLNIRTLQLSQILSHGQKININTVVRTILKKNDLESSFFKASVEILENDIARNYLATLQSDEVNKIIINNPQKNSQDYNQRYVQDNLEIYENFIPRIEEMHDNLIACSRKAIEYCAFLKDFPLYLQFGDIEKLKKRLDTKPFVSELATEIILFDEVNAFSLTLSEMPLLKKVIDYIKDNKLAFLLSVRDFFLKKISFMNEMTTITTATLAGSLEFAKKCENNLFIPPVIQSGHIRRSLKSEESVPQKGSKPKVKHVIERRISPQRILVPSPEITDSKVAFFAQQLETLRSCLNKEFVSLKNKLEGLGTKEALYNAKAHLNDLLCVFGRVTRLPDQSLSPRDLHAFVIDCVRQSILASEQMLAALIRESIRFKSEEELRTHHSHSFTLMLGSCKFPAGPLHHSLHFWAREVSRGEIIVRNLNQCHLDKGSLQNLLAKLNYFMGGNNTFTAGEIFSQTIEFCKNSAVFCGALQKQINFSTKEAVQTSSNRFLEEFQNFLQSWVRQNSYDRISAYSISLEVSNLESFRKLLESLRGNLQARGIAHSMDNVINHLFFHLETELATSKDLNLIMIHLHCKNVLLLAQTIVKEVLINLINLFQKSFITQESDSWALVQMLEIDIKCFTHMEYQFLQYGKLIRQLARYPYSYTSTYAKDDSFLISSIQKLLHDSQNLQNKEKFTNDYKFEEGYQIEDSSKLKAQINSIHKVIGEYVETSFNVLEKIIRISEVESCD